MQPRITGTQALTPSARVAACAPLPDAALQALTELDVLDVVASEEELGKPSGNDLMQGVYTLPVIRSLAGAYRARLLPLLGRPLGKEERGEGLMGLTQSFFQAGARRVVVSLWPVDDRATAELMARFYRAMLTSGSTPAAALRAAQASLRREPAWRSPAFWAGFILQGDV